MFLFISSALGESCDTVSSECSAIPYAQCDDAGLCSCIRGYKPIKGDFESAAPDEKIHCAVGTKIFSDGSMCYCQGPRFFNQIELHEIKGEISSDKINGTFGNIYKKKYSYP